MFNARYVRSGVMALFVMAVALMAAGCSSNSCCGTCGGCCDPCASPCDPCAAAVPCDLGCPPPEAKAGEAWCRVWIPPQYEEYEVEVCCKPAGCDRTWIEPVYETRTRQVCTKPACCRTIQIPAEFATEEFQVCICPARTEWQKVECTPEQLAEGEKQGDCWMLVEIPAQYETRTREVCTKPASCETVTDPPEYADEEYQVCVEPGRWEVTEIPAEYETRTERRCVCNGRWEWRRNETCEVPGDDADADAMAEMVEEAK